MLQRIARWPLTSAIVLCLLGGTLAVIHSPTEIHAQEEALSKVKEGLREYKVGNWRKAIQLFDEALAANPTDEEAKRLRDEIGLEMANDFIDSNLADAGLKSRFSRFGKWLLAGRRSQGPGGRLNNAEEIKEFVDAYMTEDDVAEVLDRGAKIRDAYGDFAVPYLQSAYMHSSNASDRYRARTLLANLGDQAVNAIIQCMYSSDPLDQQTAALALTDIGDPRALPVLAAHFQAPDADSQVKEACRVGIEKMLSSLPPSARKTGDAKDLWFAQAEAYYRNNAAGGYANNGLIGSGYAGHLPVLFTSYDRTFTVWKWVWEGDNGYLRSQEVPMWAAADLLAEESANQAFEVAVTRLGARADSDSFVRDAEALLACVRAHLYGEGMRRYYSGDDEERDSVNRLLGEEGIPPFMHARGLSAMHGVNVLSRALQRSLADGYPEVSVTLCDAMAAAGASAKDTALHRALGDPEKQIRYAAARALIALGGDVDFGRNKMVESVVTRSLQETSARSVLVISEDEALRNRLLSDVDSLGYNGASASTLEDGARMATQAPVYDAILLQGDLAMTPTFYWEPSKDAFKRGSETRMETIFDLLRDDVRTSQIPVVVACHSNELDNRKSALATRENGETFTDNSYVTFNDEYAIDTEVLGEILELTWSRNPESAKARSNRMVVDSAKALAGLNPSTTKFNVQAMLTALSGGLRLDGRTSDARIEICRAISALVSSSTRVSATWVLANVIPNLLDTIASEDDVDGALVKAAAADALGDCYAAHGKSFNNDGYEALKGMIRLEVDLSGVDEERMGEVVMNLAAARNAAGAALAKAPTTAAQRLEISKLQAVIPHGQRPGAEAEEGDEDMDDDE